MGKELEENGKITRVNQREKEENMILCVATLVANG
jgi:hypothetical protein